MRRFRILIVMLLIAAVLFVPGSSSAAQSSGNPGVVPPNARIQGLTYGDWQAVMFQTTFGIPMDQNPAIGAPWTSCYFKRVGNVGIGVGFFMPSGVFDCQMPTGTMLYMSIVASECSTIEPDPFHGDSEEELRACAEAFVPEDMYVSVDGVPVQNLDAYVATSPVYDLTLPEGNVMGLPAGTYQSVGHGAALMFTPFPPGKHTLVVRGAFPDTGFFYDWTYNITVTPGD